MYATARKRMVEASAFICEMKAAPCADCGGRFPPEAMDFDHVRGEKTWSICQMRNYTISRIKEEMAKCDLVCANCHRIRTHVSRCNGTLYKTKGVPLDVTDPQIDLFVGKLQAVK